MYITASKLYDYMQCPHKVWRDIYGPQDEKIQETNPFVELLWQKGIQHEERIVGKLGDYLDLSEGSIDERYAKTIDAMRNGASLVYQGVLKHENLVGIPDLLSKQEDGTYMPVDIKSGMGFQGADEEKGDEGKPKKHYAVQLCLYNELLKVHGFASHDQGRILDINEEEVDYNLAEPMGPKIKETFWALYERIKEQVGFLMENTIQNKPAMAGICKLCAWYNSCKGWCEETNDLSNIFYLGRSVRDIINRDLLIERYEDLITLDIAEILSRKKKDSSFLPRVGEKLLSKFINRARILHELKKPVTYEPIEFPNAKFELFFDIEDDPTQEFVYLHGIYERTNENERFVSFVAKEVSGKEEKSAWQSFWEYISSLPQDDYAIYYFSHHEKTTYKKLQKKYPDVITPERIEEFFSSPNAIDLYTQVVQKHTDWPIGSYSLKSLATYLGFEWRDETPSGALSIQWFNEFIEKKDDAILRRILEYNEDDCKATMILKDALLKIDIVAGL